MRGGTLRIGWIGGGSAETLVPGQAASNTDIWRSQQLFDTLFSLDPQGRPVPALAKSAEANAGATAWILQLRADVVWHDGKPLTAADVVAAIKSWTSQNNYQSAGPAALIDATGVRTRGPRTVEVPLLKPMADFPGVAATYAYAVGRPEVYSKGSIPIGTGPFKYRSFRPGERSVFTANREYWGVHGEPYVNTQIVASSFTDDTARLNALLGGYIDIAPALPPALLRANAHSGAIHIGTASGVNTYQFQCRVDLAPFKDPRVMLALKLLCDRPVMVESVFDGYAKQSNDLTGPGLPYFAGPDVFPVHSYDPEKAKSLLGAAGQADLQLTLLTSDIYASFVGGATLFAQQARAGGVKINVRTVDPAVYYTKQGPEGGSLVSDVHRVSRWWLRRSQPHKRLPGTDLVQGPLQRDTLWGPHTDRLLFDAIGETDSTKAKEK